MAVRTPRFQRPRIKSLSKIEEVNSWANNVDESITSILLSLKDVGREINRLTNATSQAASVTISGHATKHLPNGTDPIATAVAGTILPDAVAAAGTANSFARSDHTHAITAAIPSALAGTAAEGVATSFARSDHAHLFPPTLRSVSATAGDTVTLTSDGTDLSATLSRASADFDIRNSGGSSLFKIEGSGGFRSEGPGYIDGKGTVTQTLTTSNLLNSSLGGSGQTAHDLQTTFDSSFDPDSGSLLSGTYQHLRLSTSGGPGTAMAGAFTAFYGINFDLNATIAAGSQQWPEVVGIYFEHMLFGSGGGQEPSRVYAIKVPPLGSGTTKISISVDDMMQVARTSKLGLGRAQNTAPTNSLRSKTIAGSTIVMELNSADEYEWSTTAFYPATNGGATLGQNANGFASLILKDTAAAFETTLQFTDGAVSADNALTVDMNNASRTLDLTGNATLNQDVSTAGSPNFVSPGILDTGTAFYLKLVSDSLAPGGNFTADRTLTIDMQNAARALSIRGDSVISQNYSTSGTPQFAKLGLGVAAHGTRLLAVNDITGTAPGTTPGVVQTDYYGTGGTIYLSTPNTWLLFTDGTNTYKIPAYS